VPNAERRVGQLIDRVDGLHHRRRTIAGRVEDQRRREHGRGRLERGLQRQVPVAIVGEEDVVGDDAR
jgi:hypothetical protein